METKVNYAVVGAFVLLLAASIIGGVLWISSGGAGRKDYDTYLAFFWESVSGLNLNAPVKYKGVEVGAVREIGLDPADPQRVRLVLAIERGVPIKQDTVAVLSVQGLTGIAFLDLGGGSRESPLLEADEPGGYPVIPTGPSLLRRLDTGTTALVADLSQTAQSIGELVDAETRETLQRTLRNLDTVVAVFAERSKAIDQGLTDVAATLGHGARASAELAQLVQQVSRTAAAVERAAAEVAKAGTAAQGALDGVGQLGSEALPELQRLLAEARVLTASLARVTRELERDPSALVTGRVAPEPGPGE